MILVMKFGGSSVGDAERIRRCAGLVKQRVGKDRVAVTVSALDGVTEELLALADAAGASNRPLLEARMADLRRKHGEAAKALGVPDLVVPLLDQLDHLATGISAVGELTKRSKDAVLSFGERISVQLFRRALELEGVPARAFTGQEAGIVTDGRFGEAEPLMELSLYQVAETLNPVLEGGEVAVVTGFIAATQHGVTTTIGRGGSDFTATIVGAALKADEIWIWSDVDGLMSADPRIVKGAKLLQKISFSEAVEMGLFGAKSMHPRALEPGAEHRITMRMKNTFNPEGPGTLIGEEDDPLGGPVRSVLLVRGAALITITGAVMMGRPGTAARICQSMADEGINIKMIILSVSEAGICLVVSGPQAARARAALEASMIRTGDARHVEVEENVAIVAVIGSSMRGCPGVAARVFSAVASEGVNVIAIAQGSSELSIAFVVKGDRGPQAVRAIHNELIAKA